MSISGRLGPAGPRATAGWRRLPKARRIDARDMLALWRNLALVSAVLLVGMVLAATAARSQEQPGANARSFDDRPHGLLFRAPDGRHGFLAPTLATEVRIAINGTVERVTVRQHFVNPSNAWLEGVYIFPLPERAAVDRLVMEIGARRVIGEIRERAEAQAIYEEAAASGRRASLVSAGRPNLFTSQVANIPPGETVIVEIGYQDAVTVEDGRHAIRFPMVVAPRYVPAAAGFAGVSHQPDLARVPDATEIDGPVRDPAFGRVNPLVMTIELDAGFPLGEFASLYHPISVETAADGRRRITLAEGSVPADRDFVLEWSPAAGESAQVALFAEALPDRSGGSNTHLLVTLTPPADHHAGPARRPRDVIFVVDTSGSMAGTSIAQARAALTYALERLAPGDRFNIIRFSDTTEALFEDLKPWNAESLRTARAAVAHLEADGGTEMRPALRLALAAGSEKPGGETPRLRQVVFLTDAAIGNEAELFDDIARRLGRSRLFTIGIGSAPNSYFMRKAAELGRGSYTYIGDVTEVGERMKALLAKLESPVLTDVTVRWPAALADRVEAFPQPVPDLYRGQPVAFTARIAGIAPTQLAGAIEISAVAGDGSLWTAELPLATPKQAEGVASVWARAKLEAIEDRQWRGGNASEVRQAAIRHALAYDLVSGYTSLVAVDRQIARSEDQALHTAEVERNLPAGWEYDKVFGEATSDIDPATLPAPDALMQRISLPDSFLTDMQQLPATATPAPFQMLLGAVLLLLAGASLMLGRRIGNRPERHGR